MRLLKPRLPISPDLIGPWDELIQATKQDKIKSIINKLVIAKQQVVSLNNTIDALQAAVIELQNQTTSSSESTTGVTDISGHGGSIYVIDEVPSGPKNGSNITFGISRVPILLIVTFNGQITIGDGEDYTLYGQLIKFVPGKVPKPSTVLHAFWLGI